MIGIDLTMLVPFGRGKECLLLLRQERALAHLELTLALELVHTFVCSGLQ